MGLIKCFECGKEISDAVDNCVHCGFPTRYKKQYLENQLLSQVDVINALMLLVEVHKMEGYEDVEIVKATDCLTWARKNCELLAKDITLEVVSKLSDQPQKDLELFQNAINRQIRMKKAIFGTKPERKPTRTLKTCVKCGSIGWNNPKNCCSKCGNGTYKEVEYPNYNEQEVKDFCIIRNKLFYICNLSFNDMKPSENEYFGCLEMCDYLKEKYSLDNTVYELAGLIHTNIYWLEHAKYIPEYESLVGNFSRTGIKLDDGRDFSYSLYYYSLTLEHEYPSYMKLSEKDINNLKQNIRGELINIINLVTKFKPASTGRSDTDSDSPDFDYCLEDIQKARAHIINLVNSKKEQIRARETRKQLVESLTQPIKNTDPNYIETAECPNCHKKSVYRISDMKRGASIGFFGLFSKNIGKTMECRSCGYKW